MLIIMSPTSLAGPIDRGSTLTLSDTVLVTDAERTDRGPATHDRTLLDRMSTT